MNDRVMTDPRELVRIELRNAGFDMDSIQVPKRVYILADDIFDAMQKRGCGEYRYPIGGSLYVFKSNPQAGFIKGKMCSPGIATQAEDLAAAGVKDFVHIGLAGAIDQRLRIGDIVITDGAYHDTAVARLYGFDSDFIPAGKVLADEMEAQLNNPLIHLIRGVHWTTDAGYRETWGQIVKYRSQGALCVEMEGAGLFTIANYRNCLASAIYIITDVIDENGWHLGWESEQIGNSIDSVIDALILSLS